MNNSTSAYLPTCIAITERLCVAHEAYVDATSAPNASNAWQRCEQATLHLRMVCELILLGSTASHILDGGVELKDTEWRPKHAFYNLRQFNEHPLPMPVRVHFNEHGAGQHHVEPLSKPVDFNRLSKVYGMCGDLLHVPTLRQVLEDRKPEFDLDFIGQTLSGLGQLMMSHTLMLPERKVVMLCVWSGEASDEPQIFRMDAQGDSAFDQTLLPEFNLF